MSLFDLWITQLIITKLILTPVNICNQTGQNTLIYAALRAAVNINMPIVSNYETHTHFLVKQRNFLESYFRPNNGMLNR